MKSCKLHSVMVKTALALISKLHCRPSTCLLAGFLSEGTELDAISRVKSMLTFFSVFSDQFKSIFSGFGAKPIT